jgi:hypothetical protein
VLAGQTDQFSIAWSGLVQPRYSGSYTFYAKYVAVKSLNNERAGIAIIERLILFSLNIIVLMMDHVSM